MEEAGFQPRVVRSFRAFADLLTILFAFTASYHLYTWIIRIGLSDQAPPDPLSYATIGLLFAFLSLLIFWRLGLYRGSATILDLWELQTAAKGLALAAAVFFALLFFLKLSAGYSRFWTSAAIGTTMVLVVLQKRLLSAQVKKLQLQGRAGRRTLIYGCQGTGTLLLKKIIAAPHLGCVVIGFIDDRLPVGSSVRCRIAQISPALFEARVLGRFEELERLVAEHRANELLVAAPVASERWREVLRVCRNHRLELGVVPHLEDLRWDQVRLEDIGAIPVLRPCATASRTLYRRAKRAFDVVAASLLLVLFAPLWALAALLVRLDSPGPALFAQQRIGFQGRPFRILKFRTMRRDAPPYAPSPNGAPDARITRVGRILRVGGLDELPQLLNVLQGEMSLVGPRPEMPFIVERYSPLERERLQVEPGITGLWQLSPDRHAEIHENLEYDLYYIRHRSLLLDLTILVETVFFAAGCAVRSLSRRPIPRASSRVDPRTAVTTLPAAAGGGNGAGRPGPVTPRAADREVELRAGDRPGRIHWPPKHDVIGVPVSATTYEEAADLILLAVKLGVGATVDHMPVHGLVEASEDPAFRSCVSSFDIVAPDGQPVRWGLRVLHGIRLPDRVYGPELMLRLCERASTQGVGIYLYGSHPYVVEKLGYTLRERFPGLTIVGCEAPPFRPLTAQEDTEVVARINGSGAGLVFLGLGCPKQEVFAFDHRESIHAVQLCVGAAFDFLAGNKRMAPRWMQDRGLEWLFRLGCEPRRLWRRYSYTNTVFLKKFALQAARVKASAFAGLVLQDTFHPPPARRGESTTEDRL